MPIVELKQLAKNTRKKKKVGYKKQLRHKDNQWTIKKELKYKKK